MVTALGMSLCNLVGDVDKFEGKYRFKFLPAEWPSYSAIQRPFSFWIYLSSRSSTSTKHLSFIPQWTSSWSKAIYSADQLGWKLIVEESRWI